MNYSESSSAWAVIWDFISDFFLSIKTVMQDITIFSIGSSFHCSLWNFCLAIIIMGAIIGQFIIFAKPALPDKPTGRMIEDRKNKEVDRANRQYNRDRTSAKRERYYSKRP